MKASNTKLEDEGFEEVVAADEKQNTQLRSERSDEQQTRSERSDEQQIQNTESGTSTASGTGSSSPGAKPDFRIVQADRDKNGNVVYVSVGGMWKNVSKNGNEFYILRIGQLKLLVFPNNK